MDDYEFAEKLVRLVCYFFVCSSCPFEKYTDSDEYSCNLLDGVKIDPKDIPYVLKLLTRKLGKDNEGTLKRFFCVYKDKIQKYWCDIV